MNDIALRRYDDIINLPHHVSPRRPRMAPLQRAAQFAPFAALTGYEDAVAEKARLTERRPELTEEDCIRLNAQLTGLLSRLPERPEVMLTCFLPDEKKPGGAFVSVTGQVRRIDTTARHIIFTDGRCIPLSQVYDVQQKGGTDRSAPP